ncbi:MAG: V-type ATP synthase subunit F [Clostridia bacterium]|nr:V-type ATP synthase subunit F [Clostridia bacterium]
MYKIAVIGDRESVYGFSSLGIEIYSAYSGEEAESLINTLAKENYAVIYITEALAKEASDTIEKYSRVITPAIILIPGVSGNTGEGMSSVMKSVERAVGSALLD